MNEDQQNTEIQLSEEFAAMYVVDVDQSLSNSEDEDSEDD